MNIIRIMLLSAISYGLYAVAKHNSTKCVSGKDCIIHDKHLREDLSDKQIDHMVEDSFPASDPPASY